MDQEHSEVPALPIRKGGNPLSPRLPADQIRATRFPQYRFPNGVDGYVTTNAEDFRQVLSDARLITGRYSGEPLMGDRVIFAPAQPGHLSTLNGPDHLRVRRLAAGSFSPRAIERHRPFIHDVVRKYLDQLLALTPGRSDRELRVSYPLRGDRAPHRSTGKQHRRFSARSSRGHGRPRIGGPRIGRGSSHVVRGARVKEGKPR